MQVFNSKIGLELVIPLSAIFVVVATLLVFSGAWYIALLQLLLLAFIFHVLKNTSYTIDGDKLIIKSGILYKQTISIPEISRVKETRNPLSSPAASLDRLELRYSKYGFTLISPKEKQEFINAIISVNPNIEVIYRKK